jgi:presenilin-like A22 family membrane protease
MRAVRAFLYRFSIASELMVFLWRRKLWWLVPLVAVMLVFGLLIIFGQSTSLGPFIYPLF